MESEYFPRQKVPSYFSKIDDDEDNHGNGNGNGNGSSNGNTKTDASQNDGKGDETKTSIPHSLSFTKPGLGRFKSEGRSLAEGVTSFKSILSVSNLVNITSNSSIANMNVSMNMSMNSISGAIPTTPSDRNLSTREKDQNSLRSPRHSASIRASKSSTKLPFAPSSIRPNTTYITNDHAIMPPSGGSKSAIASLQSLDYHILNDLNFDELELEINNFPNTSASANANANTRGDKDVEEQNNDVKPTWRLKERMKTVGVGLILALNIGTDPPDISKPTPCAKLQAWMDPSSTSRAKAREKIGELLEAQYVRWQGQQRTRLRYKRALDPTVEDVRNMCNSLRRYAKNERVILHYNGSGVPKPTANGELWLFDTNHTQYIPFAVSNLKHLIGKPTLLVLDCSGAGALMHDLTKNDDNSSMDNNPVSCVKEVIVLCPTSESEILPMNPELPADLFTSCLTTPIAIALRWFIRQNPLSCGRIDPDSVDNIPGQLSDRKTPLGELNWIFTAITDTIAWNILPTSLFQTLFRQDLMVASMFRNFLLADRILRELNCTPMSYPSLPTSCNHPLWQAWDLAVETCLSQLSREGLLGKGLYPHQHRTDKENDSDNEDDNHDGNSTPSNGQGSSNRGSSGKPSERPGGNADKLNATKYNVSAPFFSEQLTAFEKWLEYSANRIEAGGEILSPPIKQHENFIGIHRMASFMYPGMSQNIESPEQLPIVLQVLLSPAHRVRALVLLRRFLYLGPSAVNLALSVGICPYVLRLLQSHIDEYKHLLVGIWSKILEFDPECKNDLVKDGALPHFIRHLHWGTQVADDRNLISDAPEFDKEDDPLLQRTMAAVILSTICSDESLGQTESLFTLGQTECLRRNLHGIIGNILSSMDTDAYSVGAEDNFDFRMWLCICLGVLCKDNATAQNEVLKADIHLQFCARLRDKAPDVRAAACFALGRLISFNESNQGLMGVVNSSDAPQMYSSSRTFLPMSNSHGSNLNSNLPWQPQPFVPLQAQSGSRSSMTPIANTEIGNSLGNLIPQMGSHNSGPFQPSVSSDFGDTVTLDQDLLIAKSILGASDDASPIVRYEATVVLGRLVRKYLAAFVSVAKSLNNGSHEKGGIIPTPAGFSAAIGDVFVATWRNIRFLHESDPHPKVSCANTAILRFVNEKILDNQCLESGNVSNIESFQGSSVKPLFSQQRTVSAVNLNIGIQRQSQLESSPRRKPNLSSIAEIGMPRSQTVDSKIGLQRSMTAATELNQSNASFLFTKDPYSPQKEPYSPQEDHTHTTAIADPNLPVSKFYELQKEIFRNSSNQPKRSSMDPLRSNDAILLHREQRNLKIDSHTKMLSKKFTLLRPLPKKRRSMLDVENDETNAAELAMEAQISSKKKALNFKEKIHLTYDGTKMTHMLKFHAYESVLAASDGANNVSVWDIKNPHHKIKNISNGNASDVKITSMSWMNERNHSLLMTGCDDGSLRIYDNVLDSKFGSTQTEPVLATAFHALPELKLSTSSRSRGSGLVTEWQQSQGQLIAGGNTPVIRCWDLTSEKCRLKIDTEVTETCATSFVTAWDYVQNESSAGGFSGLGPDIIVGGYGDGRIKIFDLRMHGNQRSASTMIERPQILRRGRYDKDHVHKNWIVNLSYTHSPAKYEIVSGTIEGDILFWDMRHSAPLRSLEMQRSAMTALACHPRIPILASGSDANFVKICSADGDTLQAFRHHHKLQNRRIGRVSTLAFHPNAPMLAAGFTDDIISIYGT